MRNLILSVLISTFAVSTAQAVGGYGAAGCGLGSLIFQDNSSKNEWWAQVLAATTNGTFANQTFGITSGTLNCDANPLVEMAHVETFIESNENAVANELAQGEGDTLVVLNYAFNCKNQKELGLAIKKNYSSVYNGTSDEPKAVAQRINAIVGSVESCNAI